MQAHTNYVRTENSQSEIFETEEGVRQCAVLSSTLFNLILDDGLEKMKRLVKKLPVSYRNMDLKQYVSALLPMNNSNIWNEALQS